MKTLILTPYKNEQFEMYQLAKDLAEELDGDVITLEFDFKIHLSPLPMLNKKVDWSKYGKVITFIYPMHQYGKTFSDSSLGKWICYDQGIPPANKRVFSKLLEKASDEVHQLEKQRNKERGR